MNPHILSQKEALKAQKEAVLSPGFWRPVGNSCGWPIKVPDKPELSARAKAEGVWNLNFPPTAWFYLC